MEDVPSGTFWYLFLTDLWLILPFYITWKHYKTSIGRPVYQEVQSDSPKTVKKNEITLSKIILFGEILRLFLVLNMAFRVWGEIFPTNGLISRHSCMLRWLLGKPHLVIATFISYFLELLLHHLPEKLPH